jgi:hypothetical protein
VTEKYYSWMSPKLEAGPFHHKGGCGVIALQPIKKGELLALWGGRVITEAELDPDMPQFTQRVIQVEKGLYLCDPLQNDPSNCFNHSCDPNAGMSGQIGLVSMRDIAQREEITLDYAMCDDTDYDEFDCVCGSPNCREHVSGHDWMRPELQKKYTGYFSPYLQRRIDALNASPEKPDSARLRS